MPKLTAEERAYYQEADRQLERLFPSNPAANNQDTSNENNLGERIQQPQQNDNSEAESNSQTDTAGASDSYSF
jgi:hypothetical protein